MSNCIQCSDFERTNQHRSHSYSLPITYEPDSITKHFSLPRRYTCVHSDNCVSLSVAHNYDKKLLSSSNDESGIIGKWIKNSDDRYEIHLKVLVSTKPHPNAASRNKNICKNLGIVLEAIALAETTLIEKYPHLGNSRILVHFRSINEDYDRVENWHRLKYWLAEPLGSRWASESQDYVGSYRRSHDKASPSDHHEPEKKNKKKHSQNRPPQMCAACRK